MGNCGEAYFGAECGEEYMLVDKEAVVGRLDMYRTKVLLYHMMVLMARPTKVRC